MEPFCVEELDEEALHGVHVHWIVQGSLFIIKVWKSCAESGTILCWGARWRDSMYTGICPPNCKGVSKNFAQSGTILCWGTRRQAFGVYIHWISYRSRNVDREGERYPASGKDLFEGIVLDILYLNNMAAEETFVPLDGKTFFCVQKWFKIT